MMEAQVQIDELRKSLSRVELKQERFDSALTATNETLKRIDAHLADIARDLKIYIPKINENSAWIEVLKKGVFFVAISVVCGGLGRIAWGIIENALSHG